LGFGLFGLLGGADLGMYGELFANPLYRLWMYASILVGGVLTVVLVASGILLLAMRREGRILSIWYAIAAIVMAVLGALIQTGVTIGPALNALSSGAMD